MKKLLVTIMLVFAAAALAQMAAPPPAQQPSAPAASTQAPATAQPGAAPTQPKKEIKDPAEYNAYVNSLNQQDPNAKSNGLEAFLQQYPNSVMKEDALELLMGTYQQMGNLAKTADTANRLLQSNPNNLRALALLAYSKRQAAEAGQNTQQNLTEATQFAQRGLQALQTMAKPEGLSDTDFQKLKAQTSVIFNGVIGLAALQQKDYRTAQQHLRAAVEGSPNNLADVYPLALAYLTAQPPDDINGLWFIARAVNLAAGSPAHSQITEFGRKRYIKYHGSEQGWTDLLAQAKGTPLPPPGFTIAAAPPPPSPAQQAQELVNSKPVKDMSFAEWELILSSGNEAAADKVWTTIKGVPLAIEGKVLQVSPTKLSIAASADDIDANKPDIELTMAASIPARLMPKEGQMLQFEGTPTAYDPNPFLMRMGKGALLTKAAKPAPKPKPGTTRRKRP
jgi:tetratricopeptide (TPR) repeat protein